MEEKETQKWITINFMSENAEIFNGKDLKQYVSIKAGEGYSFIRPLEQVSMHGDNKKGFFRVPLDYEFTLKRSVKNEEGQYITEQIKLDARSMFERMKKNDEKSQFVNIRVSQKSVVGTFDVQTENGPIEYSRLLAPGGISYIRPSEKLKKDNYNEGYVYFSMHKDSVIKCQRETEVLIGVDIEAGRNIYKVENFEMRPEQLKQLYANEKAVSKKRSLFYIKMCDERRYFENTSGLDEKALCKAYAE